jgi:hypothetical protein
MVHQLSLFYDVRQETRLQPTGKLVLDVPSEKKSSLIAELRYAIIFPAFNHILQGSEILPAVKRWKS